MKEKYAITIFERLANCSGRRERQTISLISTEELKESIAKDLEGLLNTRRAFGQDVFEGFPESAQSLCSYGMPDFVGLSLANPGDRRRICKSIEDAMEIHEKRLTRICVSLELEDGAVNRLKFVINALLLVYPLAEPVFFDALLQPCTLQYSVSRARNFSHG